MPTDLVERMNAADRLVEQARGKLIPTCQGLGHRFAQLEWEAAPELPDLSPEMQEMRSALQEAARSQSDQFCSAMQESAALFDTLNAEVTGLAQDWLTITTTTSTAIQEFEQDLTQILTSLLAAFSQLETMLATSADQVVQAQSLLDTVNSQWQAELDGSFLSQLNSRAEAVLDQLSDSETSKIDGAINDAREVGETAANELADSGKAAIEELRTEIGDAIRQLGEYVQAETSKALEEAVQKIIEAALNEIMQAILEAIATSQIGVATTSAMSPVLPYLIAANNATDVILEAIELFKQATGKDLFG